MCSYLDYGIVLSIKWIIFSMYIYVYNAALIELLLIKGIANFMTKLNLYS